ncbi:MAG: helix-turn-helix domain-containing protein [Desulfobacteraceae bacterium]|nr:helix-turn-helix domain-containing protein [Desulfobacteraceae bacterium]
MKAKFKTITIKSHDQTLHECTEIMDAVIRGEKVKQEEPQYSFTSFEAFRKALTPQRFALLKVIREKQPESIKELAAITNRDMKNISEDVKVLLDMDLIEMEKHGKSKAPRLHYDGFRLEVAV